MVRFIRCERGMSLPVALGVMMVLTIAVLGILQYTGANSRNASLSFARQDSRGVAEAGLNRAAAILAGNPTAAQGAVLPACSGAGLPAPPTVGNASWCGIKGAPDGDGVVTWTVKSTGSARNPTGPASPQLHTVSARFRVTQDAGAWEFVYIEPTGGNCMWLQNLTAINSPLYVKGNLCIKDRAKYLGPRLWVTGTINIEGSSGASVGTSADPVPTVSVRDNAPTASGCRWKDLTDTFRLSQCDFTHRVWRETFNTEVPPVQRPPVDFPYWRLNAKPGPSHFCTFYSGISTNFFTASDRDLFPSGSSYNCEVRESGVLKGRINWNHSTRVFTMDADPGEDDPTIYFDGKLLLNNRAGVDSSNRVGGIRYVGRGTVYVRDIIKISSDVRVCAVAVSCHEAIWNADTDTWNPSAPGSSVLFLISGYTDTPSIEIENGARFQGGLYSSGGLLVKSGDPGGQVQGPIVALGASIDNGADLRPWPWFSDLPDGVPSYGTPHLAFVPGSWRG
jgi:hypothetical protein